MSSRGAGVRKFSGAILLIVSSLTPSRADPEFSDRSPDKKYVLWQEYADKQPYLGDVKLIDAQLEKPVLTLDTQVEPLAKKLLWSRDSLRFAYFNDSQTGKGFTRVFFRRGDGFKEVKLPDLPEPPLPAIAARNDEPKGRTRVAPVRWTDAGDVVLEIEVISQNWGRTAIETTVRFDSQHQASVTKSEPEKSSIVDYFLLLPPDTLENPPSSWFRVMRSNGNIIDKVNGYLSCPGDGAQPEFEAALFRHRDGRPLLAYCSGVLEDADSAVLRFYELGPDGKMRPIKRWLFPVPAGGYDPEVGWTTKAKWEFKLPRTGKTIAIRSQKDHHVICRLMWNGERFVSQK